MITPSRQKSPDNQKSITELIIKNSKINGRRKAKRILESERSRAARHPEECSRGWVKTARDVRRGGDCGLRRHSRSMPAHQWPEDPLPRAGVWRRYELRRSWGARWASWPRAPSTSRQSATELAGECSYIIRGNSQLVAWRPTSCFCFNAWRHWPCSPCKQTWRSQEPNY